MITGLDIVGAEEKTRLPAVPVLSVTTVARLALLGVARNVATLEPKPETPVEMGSPVPLVKVIALGVPRLGVVKTGLVLKTMEPAEPVTVLMPWK